METQFNSHFCSKIYSFNIHNGGVYDILVSFIGWKQSLFLNINELENIKLQFNRNAFLIRILFILEVEEKG